MSALLLAAAAASFAPPSLSQAAAGALHQDGPPAAAVVDAKVDNKGRVSNCKTLAASGDAQAANAICSHLESIQVEPASVTGSSAYGILREVVSTSSAGTTLTNPADMELQVNKLPGGQTALRTVSNVLITSEGKPQACYAANDAPKAYADVACAQVSGITFGTMNDGDGKPVRYVRSVTIDFKLDAGAG